MSTDMTNQSQRIPVFVATISKKTGNNTDGLVESVVVVKLLATIFEQVNIFACSDYNKNLNFIGIHLGAIYSIWQISTLATQPNNF